MSGAKVVAADSALTHYNMIGFGSAQVMGENPDFALMFVAPNGCRWREINLPRLL
ncbi:hypothetical protein ACLB1R_31295 [Escherichia coli]